MVGKPNLPIDADKRRDVRGSSVDSYANALDQERAASMADEGGVAGAMRDSVEQAQPPRLVAFEKTSTERLRHIATIVASCAAVLLGVTAAVVMARR